jgi:hypothetical protein
MSAVDACRHARLHIGAAPRELPPEIAAHVAGCPACRRFLDESLDLETRLRTAFEVPLAQFRDRSAGSAAPRRRFAMAASVVLAMLVAGGAWLLRPQPALASELMRHIEHEAFSWEQKQILPSAALVDVLRQAGVQIDASLPVVYASACPFRGGVVPHLVVLTAQGPATIMLLPREKVFARTEFAEAGMSGVLLPAGEGSVAVVTRQGAVPEALAAQIAGAVSW